MERRLTERIERSTGCRATATSRALLEALRALSALRVVLVSPYVPAINEREAAFLEASGVSVSRAVGLGIDDPQDMIRVEPAEWYRVARESDTDDADALFLSCTAIRALEVVDALERDLGKPVVTSNQVAAWHCLRSLGIDGESGPGRLFAIP